MYLSEVHRFIRDLKYTYVIIYVKQVWLFKLSSFKTIKYDFISGTYRSFNTFSQNKDEIANDLTFKSK